MSRESNTQSLITTSCFLVYLVCNTSVTEIDSYLGFFSMHQEMSLIATSCFFIPEICYNRHVEIIFTKISRVGERREKIFSKDFNTKINILDFCNDCISDRARATFVWCGPGCI